MGTGEVLEQQTELETSLQPFLEVQSATNTLHRCGVWCVPILFVCAPGNKLSLKVTFFSYVTPPTPQFPMEDFTQS